MLRRIALFRARDDAERTAARLAEHGWRTAIAPVLEPRGLRASPPPGRFDAALATSAKAVEFYAHGLPWPLHVVGQRTGDVARRAGHRLAAPPEVDAAALARRLKATLPPGARLLYLAGRDRKPDLEADLAAHGLAVETLEVYEAAPREAWTDAEVEGLLACDGALHYSARSAGLACRLAERAGVAKSFRALAHVAISVDAAAPLLQFGVNRAMPAATPGEEALFDALGLDRRP